MTAPNGWDGIDREAFGKSIAAGNKKSQQQKSADPEHSESGGEPVDNPVVKEYNENQIKSNYRLRFMSNRDQFFRNLNNVDPLDGYMAVASDTDEATQIMIKMSSQKQKWSLDGWKIFQPKGD